MKLIDKQNRESLSEGRNYQMGFAFCKKIELGIYETIQPISPCKDYLNDVVFSEITGKPVTAYGLKTKQLGIFDKRGYIAFKICPSYSNMEKDKQNLNNNVLNIQKFMNNFEVLLKTRKSKIKKVTETEGNKGNEDSFIVSLPSDFLVGTYSISLYSLLLRVSQWYDGKQDVMEYLKTFKAFPVDTYIVNSALPKLERIIKEGFPKQNLSGMEGNTGVHNLGIVTYNW